MPVEQIKVIGEAKKTEMGITDKSKLGNLVGAVMKETKGQADGAIVKEIIEGLF
jgi:Asp-tRNA(Asn)/Glu-tRNA(Gln) amidotransferase B subunit